MKFGRRFALSAIGAVASLVLVGVMPAATALDRGAEDGRGGSGRAVVRTDDGALKGTVGDDHRAFIGVRYAAPPGRWERPTEPSPWQGVRDAANAGAECVQQATFWRPTSPASTNEDCLFLNLYTPKRGNEPKPVLVFFHGGGSINGSSTDVAPSRMAAWGDSVVVSVNYRLGIMGSLYLPELDSESPDGASGGNYANLDKVQALTWIQENIAAFGGDRDNVTIAGQSAGAGAVCWLLASPTAAGLFDRAVVQSGGSCGSASSKETAAQRGVGVAEYLGCPDEASRLACLRAKPPEDVLAAQIKLGNLGTVYGGADLPQEPAAAFASGSFNQVPVIFGNTRNEARAFVYEENDLVRQPLPASEYESSIRSKYGDRADALLAAYPVSEYESPGIARAQVQTDERVCGALPVSQSMTQYVPTYTYEFRDETAPVRPYMSVPPSFTIGSGHTSEVPYLWQSETAVPLDRTQLRLSGLMIDYWAQFARTGDPNGAGRPTWPGFATDEWLRLGLLAGGATETISGADFQEEHHCAAWLALG